MVFSYFILLACLCFAPSFSKSSSVSSFELYFCINGTENLSRELTWGALDDVVMGGVSESTFQIDPNGGENGRPTGVFRGLSFSL